MKTVLLVDDEPSMLEAISNMFTSHGWSVVTSHNGTDAAALVGERCFDLVLTDVVMEGLVGDALLYQIRASSTGGRHANRVHEQHARGAGAEHH